MRKKLPIGTSNYREVKEDNRYYIVDKSKMIEEFLDTGAKVTFIIRPRRFGKTLNMSMLSEFLDITKGSKEILQDTYFMKTEYASYLNQYQLSSYHLRELRGKKLLKNVQWVSNRRSGNIQSMVYDEL